MPRPPLRGDAEADVVVVGGGYTGLWTSLHLLDREPSLRVLLCEADTVGYGASGRNGGFCEVSLTHGLANGVRHFPGEIAELERLGRDNYADMRRFLSDHAVDCDFEPNGMLDVAVEPWQVGELREAAELYRRFGHDVELLDRSGVREHLDSPRFLGALHRPDGGAVLDPAALARGLARVATERGVAVHETTPVVRLGRHGAGVVAETPFGTVRARYAVLATNAYSGGLLARTRRYFVPVYDYVLVSEPLEPERLATIGWKRRQGASDSGNQFHYFRLVTDGGRISPPPGTPRPDDRVLWGGYDAVYHYGNGIGPHHDQRPATFARLERHFRATFPQLGDVAFGHRWGGAIATTTRFTPVFGRALEGRVVYALGYTGLGVAATRFAGQVLADRLLRPDSPLLRLRYVASRPFPFPPEPLRYAAVSAVRGALARSDRREGRRGPLLGALDRLGIGFDS